MQEDTEHTLRGVPDSEAIRVCDLAAKIKHGLLITQMPELANRVHRLEDTFMAPNLHLRLCPKQAEVLGVMLWEASYLWVSLGVVSQFLLPGGCLFFGNNAANDKTACLAGKRSKAFRELPVIRSNVGKSDLGNNGRAMLRDAVRRDSEMLCQTAIRLDDSLLISGLYDTLFELREPLLEKRAPAIISLSSTFQKVKKGVLTVGHAAVGLAPWLRFQDIICSE